MPAIIGKNRQPAPASGAATFRGMQKASTDGDQGLTKPKADRISVAINRRIRHPVVVRSIAISGTCGFVFIDSVLRVMVLAGSG